MKSTWAALSRKLALPALFAAGLLTFLTPITALAEARGGHGRSSGPSYYGGHGNSVGRAYRGGQGYYYGGGRGYYGGRYYGGGAYYGRPYYGGYAYAPPLCAPSGYYDRWGRWHPYPGCAIPYGY